MRVQRGRVRADTQVGERGVCSGLWGGCVRDNAVITAPGLESSFLADHGKPSVKIQSRVPKDKRLILNFM